MNGKAERKQIQFPPLLNIAKDRPHVDESFRNFEKVNGPFLNDMIQPVYTRNLNRKSVFDKEGNEYYISGSTLYKNGSSLISDLQNGFTREELNIPHNAIAYDYNNNNLWYVTYDSSRFTAYRDGTVVASYAISNVVVIDSRLRFVNNVGVFVIYFEQSGTEYCQILNVADMTVKYSTNVWYYQVGTETSSTISAASTRDRLPCIHIGYSSSFTPTYGVSLTTGAGKVIPMTSKDVEFITVLWNEGWTNIKQISNTFQPSRSSSSYSITLSHNMQALVTNSQSNLSTTTKTIAVRDDNNAKYYYSSGATKLQQLTICNEAIALPQWGINIGTQTIDVSDTATPQMVTFTIYQVTEYSRTYNRLVRLSDAYPLQGVIAYWYINNLGNYVLEPMNGCTLSKDTNTATVTNNENAWGQEAATLKIKWYTNQTPPTISNGSTSIKYTVSGITGTLLHTVSSDKINSNTGDSWTQTQAVSNNTYNFGVLPVVMLDNGSMYPLFYFPTQTVKSGTTTAYWSITKQTGYLIPGVSNPSYSNGSLTMYANNSQRLTNHRNFRSGSFKIDQGLFSFVMKFCNNATTNPVNLNNDTPEAGGSEFTELEFSTTYNGFRYCIGTNRLSTFNYYSNYVYNDPAITGPSEDLLVFNSTGDARNFNNYRILYNTFTSGYVNVTGISWKNADEQMGTLVTPWLSIDESSYISTSSSGILLYKDKSGKYYKISRNKAAGLFTILDGRVVVVNTSAYWNAYDSVNDEVFHYASDYNGRMRFGTTSSTYFKGAIPISATAYSAYPYIRYTANAINPLYEVMPRHINVSMMLPINPRYRCYVGAESFPMCAVPNRVDRTLGIDVFYSNFGDTVTMYRYTYPGTGTRIIKHTLNGLIYPSLTSSSPNLSPNIFTEYINGAGNNDMVKEGYDAYTLTYYDNNPVLVYSSTTQVSNLYGKYNAFFVLQGQFYGVIGDKLYSLLYSNGSISQMDAIIDLGDLKFIGNNPMISFWWDPATKVIRSFTGDANMETLYSATKLKSVSGIYFYDETTQSIYVPNEAGLLVIGPKNVYLFEDWNRVTNVQFSNDGITHITNNGQTINLKYYEDDDYIVKPLDLETSFYGIGSNELTTIDRWNVTLYDLEGKHPESYIKVGTRTLNDVTVKSEEKTVKITPDMYDKWSNSVLISFNPKLIKGQGIRLYLETPLIVQKIVPHIMDDKTGTLTSGRKSI